MSLLTLLWLFPTVAEKHRLDILQEGFYSYSEGIPCPDTLCPYNSRCHHFHCRQPRCFYVTDREDILIMHSKDFHDNIDILEGFLFFDRMVDCRLPNCHRSEPKHDLPVIGSGVYFKSDVLVHAATEAGHIIIDEKRVCKFIVKTEKTGSPMSTRSESIELNSATPLSGNSPSQLRPPFVLRTSSPESLTSKTTVVKASGTFYPLSAFSCGLGPQNMGKGGVPKSSRATSSFPPSPPRCADTTLDTKSCPVAAILVLPHGNADVERGFSQTSNYLTDNRTCLSEAAIRGMQSTKDDLKHYNYQCYTISFTKNFIKKGHGAHKLDLAGLEEEKIEAERKKQEQEDKEKIKNQKSVKLELDLDAQQQQSQSLPHQVTTSRETSTIHSEWSIENHVQFGPDQSCGRPFCKGPDVDVLAVEGGPSGGVLLCRQRPLKDLLLMGLAGAVGEAHLVRSLGRGQGRTKRTSGGRGRRERSAEGVPAINAAVEQSFSVKTYMRTALLLNV
uniref:Uncharacterized protein n=1 Tax=Timema genevievae TaxID=629358 RepID=A0A7R9JRG1_TIMGE|nr:unnamed protein product [Timema genevievae]